MMTIIHYHRVTGRIGAWGSGDSESSHLPDHDILRLDTELVIDPKRHKIADGEIVEVTAEELDAGWNWPTDSELVAWIQIELNLTDQFMMPDREVADRLEWVRYRQALRNLSDLPTVKAKLEAWPSRPDGKDSRP